MEINQAAIESSFETTINDLPFELLPFIFQHLGIVALTKIRLVNKLWKFVIERLRIKEMVLINNKLDELSNWCFTNDRVDYKNVVRLDIFGTEYLAFKKQVVKLRFLSNLKHLKIGSQPEVDGRSIFIYLASKFTKLEQLDIGYKIEDSLIHHPNLKILSIEDIANQHRPLEIDCPVLNKLFFNGCIHSLEIAHSETIEHLRIVCSCGEHDLNLSEFENLQYLDFQIAQVTDLDANIFALSSLKEVHCFTLPSRMVTVAAKRFLVNLLDQNLMRQKEIKFFYQGVQLGVHVYDLYNFSTPIEDLHFQMINYNLLSDNLFYFSKLNYTYLMNEISSKSPFSRFANLELINEIPKDFFQHFFNIIDVYTREVKNQDHFISFIKNCPNLKGLYLNHPSFNQSFYSQLPHLCRLTNLRILERSDSIVNFDFIHKITYLTYFRTNLRLPIQLAKRLFEKSSFIDHCKFQAENGGRMIVIKRNSSRDKFSLNYYKANSTSSIFTCKNINLNELLSTCDTLK